MITSSQSATPLTTMTLTGNTNSIGVSTSSGVSGVVLTKPVQAVGAQQTLVGNSSQMVPTNVQIVNMNSMRAVTPNQPGAKTMSQRVMIGTPQMVANRPGQSGQITLQSLQGLAPGSQGHLLLKTESGQYQLLRVGPAPGAAQQTPGTPISGNNFRVNSIGANTPGGAVQTQVPALAAQSSATGTQNNIQQRGAVDQTKEKCRKFLANLLELSSREPKSVEKNVRHLIQELVDTKVEPEQFCDRLERILNASPQPCLIGFLKKSLPFLRQSMVNNELVIDGIRPPPPSVLHAMPLNAQIRGSIQMATNPQLKVISQQALRPGQQVQHRLISPLRMGSNIVNASGIKTSIATIRTSSGSIRPQVVRTPIITRPGQTINAKTPFVTRPVIATNQFPPSIIMKPGQPQQPIKEKRTFSSSGFVPVQTNNAKTPFVIRPVSTTNQFPPSIIMKPGQPQQPIKEKRTFSSSGFVPVQTNNAKTPFVTRPVSAYNQFPPSIIMNPGQPQQPKKEKRTFSSSRHDGDDDINDVAAMGGVNLAEESQRILGSTEFVGTQIRSCKDELYLHTVPLMSKIAKIAKKHGLEEPSLEVASMMSHAVQEKLKNFIEKLSVISEHRADLNKADPKYEVCHDVRTQLKCLEEVDRAEKKRHEEVEREVLIRVAKSRIKPEDVEQARLKAKAKEMQKAEMDELRHREANVTALSAIGSRKRPRMDDASTNSSSLVGLSGSGSSTASNRIIRPRTKRVCFRDLLALMEQEKETCKSSLIFKSYLK